HGPATACVGTQFKLRFAHVTSATDYCIAHATVAGPGRGSRHGIHAFAFATLVRKGLRRHAPNGSTGSNGSVHAAIALRLLCHCRTLLEQRGGPSREGCGNRLSPTF